MRWLTREIEAWRMAGVVDDSAAAVIADRYETSSRTRAARLLLMLGAALLGVGTIWLVASNLKLDEIGPVTRVASVALLWLGLVALAEITRASARLSVLACPLALLAAITYGATIFQVAQSLQVPAYESWLLAAWGIGALAYAYATANSGALVIGIAATVGSFVWLLTRGTDGGTSFVLGLGLVVPLTAAAAVLHERRSRPRPHGSERVRFAAGWRLAAATLALLALGSAAIPDALEKASLHALAPALAAGGCAVLIAAAAAVRADRLGRLELAGAVGVAVAALVLVLAAPGSPAAPFSGEDLPTGQLAHALVASALFLALGVGLALLGVSRASAALTNLALAGIVAFVVIQSFGLIAPLLSGAALLLSVGAILVACGLLAARGRRHLAREIAS